MQVNESPIESANAERCHDAKEVRAFRRGVDLHKTLAHERLRSDRSHLPFCMIELEIAGEPSAIEQALELIRLRVRATDKIGWLEDGKLGIITPYTDASGASVLAENLLSLLPRGIAEPEIKIHEYAGTARSRHDLRPSKRQRMQPIGQSK